MDTPEINILLLGDEDVGKSTFLSRITLGPTSPSTNGNPTTLPILKDLDQPFAFDVRFSGRPFRLNFHDTDSPQNYTLLHPSVLILCYAIPSRASLLSVSTRWKHVVETHFNYDETMPVILLGLQRDLRTEDGQGAEDVVFPHEGLRFAQEMRCDRYCECSALTGELCREVFEDVARTAALTTTERGGRSEPPPCSVM